MARENYGCSARAQRKEELGAADWIVFPIFIYWSPNPKCGEF